MEHSLSWTWHRTCYKSYPSVCAWASHSLYETTPGWWKLSSPWAYFFDLLTNSNWVFSNYINVSEETCKYSKDIYWSLLYICRNDSRTSLLWLTPSNLVSETGSSSISAMTASLAMVEPSQQTEQGSTCLDPVASRSGHQMRLCGWMA